ncbi:MAG: SURF1 family protein [Hyphomicrobiaceae bacterium]
MLRKLRAAGLIWPTVFAMPALAVLVSLGIWQWQRHAWKVDLLARLEQSTKASPANLSEILAVDKRSDIRFRRVRFRGHFDHDREFHVWSPGEGGTAWRVITPLRLGSTPKESVGTGIEQILVIRGTVSDAHKSPARRSQGQIPDAHVVVGRIRFASVNWATPAADLERNAWYGLDLAGMRAHLAKAGASPGSGRTAPFFVESEAAVGPPPSPQPDFGRLRLRNRHLEYAMTWWGLALTLIGVYLGFAKVRLRRLVSPS